MKFGAPDQQVRGAAFGPSGLGCSPMCVVVLMCIAARAAWLRVGCSCCFCSGNSCCRSLSCYPAPACKPRVLPHVAAASQHSMLTCVQSLLPAGLGGCAGGAADCDGARVVSLGVGAEAGRDRKVPRSCWSGMPRVFGCGVATAAWRSRYCRGQRGCNPAAALAACRRTPCILCCRTWAVRMRCARTLGIRSTDRSTKLPVCCLPACPQVPGQC